MRLFSGGDRHSSVELLISSLPASVLKPGSAFEDTLKGTLRLPEPHLASVGCREHPSPPRGQPLPSHRPLYSASPSRHTGSACKACQLDISSREQGSFQPGEWGRTRDRLMGKHLIRPSLVQGSWWECSA